MKRSLVILYILAFYILFQFGWWAYLLISLNNEVFHHRIENVGLQTMTDEQRTATTILLEKKVSYRHWMVMGEGLVFLSLLSWGTIMMMRTFRKEMALARQQKNFLLSITHEFKSPLASIKLYLQTLQKHDLDKQKSNAFISSAIGDTDRLNNLVENALMANLIDHNGYAFSKEDINFSALMRLIVQKFQHNPDHSKIESKIEEGIYIYGDKNALDILINNLLENGMKYSPKGSLIEVTVSTNEKKIICSIADMGNGIPESEKSNIFNKFYRLGNEETRQTKGTGLGLFIVKYIVEEHGGKITIVDNQPKGTIFQIELPLLQV